jgi:hypothetical protein
MKHDRRLSITCLIPELILLIVVSADHQLAASAMAMPTPTTDNPPTTKASHTTSLASSRMDFRMDVLPPSASNSNFSNVISAMCPGLSQMPTGVAAGPWART